jgi:hypothetical protein
MDAVSTERGVEDRKWGKGVSWGLKGLLKRKEGDDKGKTEVGLL